MVVVAVVALVFLGERNERPSPPSHAAVTEALDNDLASQASPTAPVEDHLDPEAALVTLDDLPDGWAPAGDRVGRVRPEQGFCSRSVEADSLDHATVAPFEAAPGGPYLVSVVQVHDTADGAEAYLDEIEATARCERWIDSVGVRQQVGTRAVVTPADAERAVGFVQISESSSSTFRADIVYLRHGRTVAMVTAIHAGDADEPVVPDLVGLLSGCLARSRR